MMYSGGVIVCLLFFLMARKSNMMSNSVNSFDTHKQLTRGDVRRSEKLLLVTLKWSKN